MKAPVSFIILYLLMLLPLGSGFADDKLTLYDRNKARLEYQRRNQDNYNYNYNRNQNQNYYYNDRSYYYDDYNQQNSGRPQNPWD